MDSYFRRNDGAIARRVVVCECSQRGSMIIIETVLERPRSGRTSQDSASRLLERQEHLSHPPAGVAQWQSSGFINRTVDVSKPLKVSFNCKIIILLSLNNIFRSIEPQ